MVISAEEEAPVNLGMERLYPTFKQFWGASVFGHVDDWQASFTKRFGGAARGQEFDSMIVEFLGKGHEARFVGYGEQSALNSHEMSWRDVEMAR